MANEKEEVKPKKDVEQSIKNMIVYLKENEDTTNDFILSAIGHLEAAGRKLERKRTEN